MTTGWMRKAFVAAVAVAGLCACGTGTASAGASSTGPFPATEHPPTGASKYDPSYLGPWQLTSLSSLVGDPTIPAFRLHQQVNINFATNGRVSGFDGLNHWEGRFARADAIVPQIKISDVAAGAQGLGPHASAVQVELAKAFNLIRSGQPLTMHVDGNQLTIRVGQISLTATRPGAN